MPFARPSQFKGASGILRDVDAQIVGLEFTTDNPLYTGDKPKTSDFNALFAVLDVLVDGASAPSKQPIFVGDADAFGVTDDKMGITGDGQLSKSSGWWIFLDSLVKAEFPEDAFPDDDPSVADYSALVGARVKFNWQKNEKATKKLGQKVSKKIDPKTGKPQRFDREDLIVTAYYGTAPIPAVGKTTTAKPGVSKTQPAGQAKPLGGAKKGAAVDVAAIASENIIAALTAAKGNTLSKSKVSVKLLSLLSTQSPEVREQVRSWADSDQNIGGIDGVDYDPKTGFLSLEAAAE